MPTVTLELAERANALALEVLDRHQQPAQDPEPRSIDQRIATASPGPASRSPSPICAPPAASAPPRFTSAWPP